MKLAHDLRPASHVTVERDVHPAKPDATRAQAQQFEGVFVRQILETSHLAAAGGGYASLAIDALAGAIEAGGGLGLADLITRALRR